MRVHVCTCVYACVFLRACFCVCLCVCLCMSLCVRAHLCLCLCVYLLFRLVPTPALGECAVFVCVVSALGCPLSVLLVEFVALV